MITNKLNLPQPFVDAASREHTYKPKRYSVTSVLKGTREAILQRRHNEEIDTDVSDCVWLIFGSAVHSILENSKETDTQLKENYITADMPNGYVLSGIFDLYDDATGTVTDYKTGTVWKVIYDEWDDYRMQTLLYCWMLREMGFDAKRGQIVVMLKDHSKSKAKRERSYPQHPVITKTWDFTAEDFEEAERFLMDKFAEIERAEQLPDDELPLCSSYDRWAKPSKWAVMKKGRKTAIKLYETQAEADQRAETENANASGNPYYVEHRPGTDGKCTDYCQVCEFCSYWREKYGDSQEG